MEAFDCIKTRRSVRRYSNQQIEDKSVNKILEAAIFTPSGKNGQPWKFKMVTDKQIIIQLSDLSIYGSWMQTAPLFITVFLDNSCSYHHLKDVQSCGAVMQNMMLAAHSLGIGSCWIGEILYKADEVKRILQIDNTNLELMGIVTFGYKAERTLAVGRKKLESFLL